MKKISIIIPVHNTERYLSRCVESCLNQTLPRDEYEIILIDDCSSDSCPNLIKEYADRYDNIIPIFLSVNLRQGGARNRGLEIAQGEYIAFVDSDDWIECDMCEKLYSVAKNSNSDMAGGNYFISSSDGKDRIVNLNYSSGEISRSCNYTTNCGFFVTRIYRHQFLIENKIFFPERSFYEDAYFNFLTALYANRVEKVEQSFYHYFRHPESTVASKNDIRQYERFNIAELIFQDCQKRGFFEEFKDIIEYKYIIMHTSTILYTCLSKFDKPDKERIKDIVCAVKKNCPKFRKSKYYKKIDFTQRFYLNLSIITPRLAILCYKFNVQKYLEIMQIIITKLNFKK